MKISEEERMEIFSRFWQIGDLMLQREFVRSNITEVNRSLDLPNSAARSTNQAFYLETENGRLANMQEIFYSHPGDQPQMDLYYQEENNNGFLEEDLRGRHNNRKKVDTEILSDMRAHIQSIPRIQSHYLREQTSKEYIEGNKTIRSIYRDYVDFCKEKSKPYGSEDKFRRIFNTEFNISKERRVCVAPLE
uniref:Uncharacterized protein n=2 Tax=Lygus hesperus TaxID=30085 RepID=A0A0K8SL42_LYGHE